MNYNGTGINADLGRLKSVALVVIIGAWFLVNSWPGLLVYFQSDDVMNLYQVQGTPWYTLIVANILPFTKVFRPVGGSFYAVLYTLGGLNPLWFRMVAFTLLAFNIWLAFRIAKRLTGSAEIAVLTALFLAYHERLIDLYQNDGTIYDILCFTFFYLAMDRYITARERGESLRGWRLVGFVALVIAAINSKEMAVTLAAALWVYEWVVASRWKGNWAVWLATVVCIGAAIGKTGKGSSFDTVSDYLPHFTVHQYFLTTRSWLSHLFLLRENAVNTTWCVVIFAGVFVAAWLSRKRYMWFCAVLTLLLPLPVNFIALRGFFAMYIPLLPWAIIVATVLVNGRNWLWRAVWKRPALPENTWEPERVMLFLAVMAGMLVAQSYHRFRGFEWVDPSQPALKSLHSALSSCPSSSKRVLMLNDPIADWGYTPVTFTRLFFHDRDIVMERAQETAGGYDCVVRYVRNGFVKD